MVPPRLALRVLPNVVCVDQGVLQDTGHHGGGGPEVDLHEALYLLHDARLLVEGKELHAAVLAAVARVALALERGLHADASAGALVGAPLARGSRRLFRRRDGSGQREQELGREEQRQRAPPGPPRLRFRGEAPHGVQ